MLNLHAHVEKARGVLATEFRDAELMALDRAVTLIAEDRLKGHQFRLRRTQILLLAHGSERDGLLGALAKTMTARRLAQVLRTFDARRRPGACQIDADDTESDASEVLNERLGRVCEGTCCWEKFTSTVFPAGEDVGVYVRITLDGPTLGDLRKRLDPQNWATCSLLWRKSHLTRLIPNTDDPEVDANGDPVVDTTIAPGSAYGGFKPLYEHFGCSGNCDVKLLLDVQAQLPTGGYKVEYERPRPRPESAVKVTVDEGDVRIEETNTGFAVETNKKFGFKRGGQNAMAYLMMRSIETAQLLGDLTCCQP